MIKRLTVIFVLLVLMMGISPQLCSASPDYIGSDAIDRDNYGSFPNTYVNRNNPCSGDGVVTSVTIFAYEDLSDVEVAMFYANGNFLTTRSMQFIGDVVAGSPQMFTTNMDALLGDYIGIYATGGRLEYGRTGGVGEWSSYGQKCIPCVNQEFDPGSLGTTQISLQGILTLSSPPDPPTSGNIITDDSYYNAFGDITLLPSGDLLIVYVKGADHSSPLHLVTRRSSDLGVTWQAEQIVATGTSSLKYGTNSIATLSDGTVVISVQLRGEPGVAGRLLVNGVGLFRSTDDGQTWSDLIRPDVNGDGLSWHTGRVIEMPDGSLRSAIGTLPEGYLYGEIPHSVHMISSVDKGLTWGDERVIAEGSEEGWGEPFLVYLGNGDIICFLRYGNYMPGAYTYAIESSDYGTTWSLPAPSFQSVGKPSVSLLPNGDLITITRHDGLDDTQRDLYVPVYRISNDEGATWSEEVNIEDFGLALYGGSVGIKEGTTTTVYVVYFVETSSTTAQARFARVINTWECQK